MVTSILTGSNNHSEYRALKSALSAKAKLAFVDDTRTRPSPQDADFIAWNRCNNIVISRILNGVAREIVECYK